MVSNIKMCHQADWCFADMLLTYFVSSVKFALYSNGKFYNNLSVFCHAYGLKPCDSDLNAGMFLF